MRTDPAELWSVPQRQAPAGIFLIIVKAFIRILRIFWPLILILIFRGRDQEANTFELLLVLIPISILLNSILEFYYFSFFIQNDHLVIRKGFFRKKEISIPLSRIHAVNIEQGVLQQFLEIVKLKIDTAGTDSTEAVIDAIDQRRAELLKALLLQSKSEADDAENAILPNEHVIITGLSFKELVYLGLSANHLQAFTIILAFAISFVQNLDEIFGDQVVGYVQESYYNFSKSAKLVIMLIIVLFVFSVIVSFVKVFLTYSNFHVVRSDSGLKITNGLLERRENIVPFTKIQFISFSSTYIGRMIRLGYFRFHQARTEEKGRSRAQRLPITEARYLDQLVATYADKVAGSPSSAYVMHLSYVIRRVFIGAVPISLIITTALYFRLGWNSLYFLLIIPYVAIEALVYVRNYRVHVHEEGLQVKSGVWGRKTEILIWNNVQQVDVVQSVFQKQSNTANCILRTAGGNIVIPFIHHELAKWIMNYSLFRVESSKRSWM